MKNTVLIITQEMDFHANALVAQFKETKRNCNLLRFDFSYFPQQASFATSNATNSDGDLEWTKLIRFFDFEMDLRDVISVWYRRPSGFELPSTMHPSEQDFSMSEWRSAVGGMLREINALWVNHPDRLITAAFKILQLQQAQKLNFTVPKTIITNNPDDVVRFFHQQDGQVIYKTLSSMPITTENGGGVIYTSTVTEEHMAEIDYIKNAPGIFQRKIEKRLDVRVTVVGTKVFSAAIHSQSEEKSKTDFRTLGSELEHSTIKLPEEIENKCIELTKAFGLNYSAIDLILTPDNKYVFLEMNSNGQYLWVEQKTGLPITRSLIDLLTHST